MLVYSEITNQQLYFEDNRRLPTNNGIPNTSKVTKVSYFQFKCKDASSSMNMQTYIKTYVTVDIHKHIRDCRHIYVCVCVYIYIYIYSLAFSLEGRAWQEPEPSHVTGMALAHCILGKSFGVVCHCFPPPLNVPTLAVRCLRPQRRERS